MGFQLSLSLCSIFSSLRHSPPCLLLMHLVLQLEHTACGTLGHHISVWSWALLVTTSQQRLCTSIPLQLGWETGNEEELLSSWLCTQGGHLPTCLLLAERHVKTKILYRLIHCLFGDDVVAFQTWCNFISIKHPTLNFAMSVRLI